MIEKTNARPGEYEKYFIKIKFNSDDNLPLNKIIKFHNLIIVVRSVFKEDGRVNIIGNLFRWMFV